MVIGRSTSSRTLDTANDKTKTASLTTIMHFIQRLTSLRYIFTSLKNCYMCMARNIIFFKWDRDPFRLCAEMKDIGRRRQREAGVGVDLWEYSLY